MTPYFIFILLASATYISALQQYLKFYAEKDQRGESITLGTNVRDLETFIDIITVDGSYEVLGWWTCMTGKDYTGTPLSLGGHLNMTKGNNEKEFEEGDAWIPPLSCRHHGALDTEDIALSLYSGKDYTGFEQFITGPAAVVSLQSVGSYSMTGKSNWTFYEGSHFNGTPTHITSSDQVKEMDMNTVLIKSVAEHCDSNDD